MTFLKINQSAFCYTRAMRAAGAESDFNFRKGKSMRNATLIVMALALMIVAGCQWGNPRGGGSDRDEGFRVVVPRSSTQVKQGDTESVRVSLDRGPSFKRDVTLGISSSEGIAVEPAHVLISASDRPEAQVRITAATDAAIGTYRVNVNATPATGKSTSAMFSVEVVSP